MSKTVIATVWESRFRLAVIVIAASLAGSASLRAQTNADSMQETKKSDKKAKKSDVPVEYRPGHGIYLHAKDATLRIRTYVQPMLRLSSNSNLPDASATWILRRARLDLESNLPNHLWLRFAVQSKNMHWGLNNLYGSWAPDKKTEVAVGYLKPPGGLERDANSFDEPFIERSVLAFLTFDKEVGARLRREVHHHTLGYGLSVSRPAPFGTDGGDPEDAPKLPPGVDLEDIQSGIGNWDVNGRVWRATTNRFEMGLTGGIRTREADVGDRLAEPYDTQIYRGIPYKGLNMHLSADAATSMEHVRVMAEGGFRRDGRTTDPSATGHAQTELGYVTFGYTPHGHYGAAHDNAPLLDGWEIITRIEAAHLVPPRNDGGTTTWYSVTSGVHWELTDQLRMQSDVAYEHFDASANGTSNAGARRLFGQIWMTLRM